MLVTAFALCISATKTYAQSDSKPSKIDLRYIPTTTLFAIGLNPAELAAQKASKPLADLVMSYLGSGPQPIKPEQLSNLCVMILPPTLSGGNESNFVIRVTPQDAKSVEALNNFATKQRLVTHKADDKTILLGSSDRAVQFCLLAGTEGAQNSSWASYWDSASSRGIAFMAAPSLALAVSREAHVLLREIVETDPTVRRIPPRSSLESCEFIVGSITMDQELQISLLAQTTSGKVAETLTAESRVLISRLRGLMFGFLGSMLTEPNGASNPLAKYLGELEQMLEGSKISQSNSTVRITMGSKGGFAGRMANMAGPSVKTISSAKNRLQSANSLRQLGLAMHNYESAYKRLPAAVQIGPKDVAHSWRVSILSFTEHAPLLEKYKMDQAWDSPENAEFLKQMPSLFGVSEAGETGYRVVVSPEKTNGAIFNAEPAARGPAFGMILDGLSNTILIVESAKTVPWTKPDEILYDPSGPPLQVSDINPQGFNVVMADCTVRFIPPNLPSDALKAFITRGASDAAAVETLKEVK